MKLDLDNNEIKRLYVEERKLIKEIAEIMHCGKTTIQSRLKEMGVETTKKRSGRSIDKLSDYKARIKQLYLEGKSSNEIGKILGKSGKTISHHLRQMEVEIRPTKKINQEEFETDDGVNYFVGEFCAFCEQNGIAARVNNTTGTINRTTIRPSFGHSIYLAATGCWTHYYTNVTLYCSGAENITISLGTIKAANFRGQLVKKLGKLIKFE